MNTFEQDFARVDESRLQARTISNKLIKSILDIGKAQKIHDKQRRTIDDNEREIAQLKCLNRKSKTTLMVALVEKDECMTKKSALQSNNDFLQDQNLALQAELDDLLKGDEVAEICEKFSFNEQISLSKEIQDARYKLMKYGFPPSFFV